MPVPTLLAVPIVAPDPDLAGQVEAARQAGADLVELRVDLIRDIAAVADLLQKPIPLPVIVTVRSADEGGAWEASDAQRVEVLQRLAGLGPAYIDVEWSTWQRYPDLRSSLIGVGASGARTRVIISHHHWHETPADLTTLFDRLTATHADVIKAVFMTRDALDALRILVHLQRYRHARPLIALGMGPAGLPTRVLARKCGAFLTFATLAAGGESAPGQPPLPELKTRYRWDTINPATRVYGVVGWPVAHSQSPAVHNAAMQAEGIDGVYLPLPVPPGADDFTAFMDYLVAHPELGIIGLSVTIPHKTHALDWLQRAGGAVDDVARRCGAVNTLSLKADGRWAGTNTDSTGVLEALGRSGFPVDERASGKRVAVLGAGGMARAVLAALVPLRCAVTIFNRRADRARQLATEFRCAYRAWEERATHHAELVVNCTAAGLWPKVDETPLPYDGLHAGLVVCETVYRPARTRLLLEAAAAGCEAVEGRAVFIGQASAQFRYWHGRSPSQELLWNALRGEGDG